MRVVSWLVMDIAFLLRWISIIIRLNVCVFDQCSNMTLVHRAYSSGQSMMTSSSLVQKRWFCQGDGQANKMDFVFSTVSQQPRWFPGFASELLRMIFSGKCTMYIVQCIHIIYYFCTISVYYRLVLVDTWWYWVSIGRYCVSMGRYCVSMGRCWLVLGDMGQFGVALFGT